MDLNFKAVIIEEAEFLNEESWNAILKTLEEPSGNAVIFISSSGISAIPKTVLSRVLSMPFYSVDDAKKQSGAQNDIIISRLLNMSGMSVAEKFDLAEKIASSGNAVAIGSVEFTTFTQATLSLGGDTGSATGFQANSASIRKIGSLIFE